MGINKKITKNYAREDLEKIQSMADNLKNIINEISYCQNYADDFDDSRKERLPEIQTIDGEKIIDSEVIRDKNYQDIINEELNAIEFSEPLRKFMENKWIFIKNRDVYCATRSMSVYPDMNHNFQPIVLKYGGTVSKALELIKENEHYNRYGLDWDIQNRYECICNLCERKDHPFMKDKYDGSIHGFNYYTLKGKGDEVQLGRTSRVYYKSKYDQLVIPVFRLINEKDQGGIDEGIGGSLFTFKSEPNDEFDCLFVVDNYIEEPQTPIYSVKDVKNRALLKLFILNKFIPDFSHTDSRSKIENEYMGIYEKVQKNPLCYLPYIKKSVTDGSGNIVVDMDIEALERDIMDGDPRENLGENSVVYTLENGRKISITFNNGEIIKSSYEDGESPELERDGKGNLVREL